MILIDDREVTQHLDIPELLHVEHRIERLDSADYAFLDRNEDPVGIERSEIGNLVGKLLSGELESQMYKCQDSYSSVILLIEGVYDSVDGLLAIYKPSSRGYFRVHVYPRIRFDYIKAVEVRLSELGIEIIDSPTFKDSITTIETLYNQRRKPEDAHTLFKRTRTVKLPTKLTSNPSVPKLMALIPRLSEKVAIRLVYKYDTLWNIIHADDKELMEVQGVSKLTVQKLRDSLGKE